MTYLDKIMEYLDKDALVSKLGLEPKPSAADKVLSTAGLLGAGVLLGAGATLFLLKRGERDLQDSVRGKMSGGNQIGDVGASQADLGGNAHQPTV